MHLQKVISRRRQETERRKYVGLMLTATASMLPMVGIAFTLIFIVHQYRLSPFQSPIEDLRSNTSTYNPAFYYVKFSATQLTTVASWASTAALVLPGSIMSLYWHRQALSMQEYVRKGTNGVMPSPYEYSLLLVLRTGGLPALWEWIQHHLFRRERRGNVLVSKSGKLLMTILLLGVLIGITDTILHVTTETMNFDQISANRNMQQSYGRQLPQDCSLGFVNGSRVACTLEIPPLDAEELDKLINPSAFYDVLNNRSLAGDKVLAADFQGQRLSYLVPTAPVPNLDYKATTIASRSECHSATQQCHANSTHYHCSPLFNSTTAANKWYIGKADGNAINLAIFPDKGLIDVSFSSLPNPFYTIAQVLIYAGNTPGAGVDTVGLSFNETGIKGGHTYFLRCTTSFLNVTYTSINSTLTVREALPITDPNIIYSLAEINVQGRSGYATSRILDGALTAFFKNTPAEANEAFAVQYDTTFLAAAASVIKRVPNIEEQIRTTILVARVQKWALIPLILILLISSLIALIVALIALCSRSPSKALEDHAMKAHADSSCQTPSIKDIVEEYVKAGRTDRLGILRTEQGNWEYVCQIPESKMLEQTDTGPNTTVSEMFKQDGKAFGRGSGLFGIPLVKFGSADNSGMNSDLDFGDDEGLPDFFPEIEKGLVRGDYRAI